MEIIASSSYVRVAPRKMQLLVASISHLSPSDAIVQLTHINKSGSMPLKKVINSALTNAKNKQANMTQLHFVHINVLAGGAMKRFQPVSRGMAHAYKKRMSHVKIILSDVPTKKIAAPIIKKMDTSAVKSETQKIEKTEETHK